MRVAESRAVERNGKWFYELQWGRNMRVAESCSLVGLDGYQYGFNGAAT